MTSQPAQLAKMTTTITTTTTLTSFPYDRMTNAKVFSVNASSCTFELRMHLGDVLGGLLSSQELEVWFIDVISVDNGNMKHARAIEFD